MYIKMEFGTNYGFSSSFFMNSGLLGLQVRLREDRGREARPMSWGIRDDGGKASEKEAQFLPLFDLGFGD